MFSKMLDRESAPGCAATSKAPPAVPTTPGEDTDGNDPAKNLGLHRLTLLRRIPRREFMGELSNAEHCRLPGRQSGTVM